MDRLVKRALKAAHCTGNFIGGTFPYKQIRVTMGGKKVTGPHCLELEEFRGHSTARRFFIKKGIVLFAHFDAIWWMGYNWASTPNHSVLSLPNRFLDGAAVTQSYLFGRKTLSINACNVGTNMRTQNTSHNAETRGGCSNARIQLRPSWMFWTRQYCIRVD